MPLPNEALLPYALCAPEDVQGLLVGTAVTGNSAEVIGRLINQFSDMMQGASFLNRELERKARTEYFDVGNEYWEPLVGQCSKFQIKAPPIAESSADPPVPTISVWNSSERVYDSTSLLALYDDYTVDAGRGWVKSVGGIWASGPKSLKVTYTGGLVVPATDDQSRSVGPADLRHAAAMQVAAWYQRRKELNVESIGFPQGGAISLNDPSKLLSHVRTVIQRYRVYRSIS